HDIGGIGIIARQPPRERITGVEVGQHHRLEPASPTPLRDPRHALFYPAAGKTAANRRLFPLIGADALAINRRLQSLTPDVTLGARKRGDAMDMTGEFRIPAPRQRVWEGLNDPQILKECIPRCQTIEKVSDTEFTAKVLAQVGPVKANFAGKVTLADLEPPQSYTIAGEGSGGVAGFAKGSAKVNLAEDGSITVLNYAVQAHVGGKL